MVFLNSRHFKVGMINLAELLLGVLIADKKKKKTSSLLHCLLRYCILSYCCNSVFGVVFRVYADASLCEMYNTSSKEL